MRKFKKTLGDDYDKLNNTITLGKILDNNDTYIKEALTKKYPNLNLYGISIEDKQDYNPN